MDDILNLTTPDLQLDTLAINLLLSIILSSFTAWFYIRFGRSLSNRSRFANNLPPLAITTVLIISIVQSSLALSLGLVGSLSIVRFRTAIKEPEELVFLFLAIATGLGIGANQRMPTTMAVAIILAYLYLRLQITTQNQKSNLYISIAVDDTNATFADIKEIVQQHSEVAELRRLDTVAGSINVAWMLQVKSIDDLSPLIIAVRARYPLAELSFIEQANMLTA
ncbi:MAG: DUF4956 domain-containing protein [Chloroflexi bacterium]|nr:DUF4956 domain-containing protein [Chloroflexota bacterium]MBP8056998.1 DUF4956 domain-containing protein [Chloroflexota bacterium]